MAEKIEQIIGKMKKGEKKTIIYEMMWTESTFNFGEVLPTNDDVSSKKEEPSSCRFSNDDCFENAYKKAIETSKELASIGKRGKQLSDDDKKKYNKLKDNYKGLIKPNYDSEVKKLFIKRFGIKNETDFKDKYDMAVSGSGNESFKITTLHSSSLCCLLFFYNVTENNPLILPLTTNKGNRTVKFTKSVFEFKSKVFNAPSNIDVVLIGKVTDEGEDKDKTVLLFLESKFAEYYLSSGGTCDIGRGYLDNYSDKESEFPGAVICRDFYRIGDQDNAAIDLKKIHNALNKIPIEEAEKKGIEFDLPKLSSLGLKIKIKKEKKKDGEENRKDKYIYQLVKTNKKDKSFYIHGIKQMISHYIGIKNLMSGEPYYADDSTDGNNNQDIQDKIISRNGNGKEVKNGYKLKPNVIVILGEIVFKLPFEEGMQAFNAYKEKYKKLAKIIAEKEAANSQFEIMSNLRDYSELFTYKDSKFEVEPKIIDFYKIKDYCDAGKPGILS